VLVLVLALLLVLLLVFLLVLVRLSDLRKSAALERRLQQLPNPVARAGAPWDRSSTQVRSSLAERLELA